MSDGLAKRLGNDGLALGGPKQSGIRAQIGVVGRLLMIHRPGNIPSQLLQAPAGELLRTTFGQEVRHANVNGSSGGDRP